MMSNTDHESHDCLEAALIYAAESDVWEITQNEIVTSRPSQLDTVRVETVDSFDDAGIYAALDRGVPLDVVLAMAAVRE
jgi:hypothetical protein